MAIFNMLVAADLRGQIALSRIEEFDHLVPTIWEAQNKFLLNERMIRNFISS